MKKRLIQRWIKRLQREFHPLPNPPPSRGRIGAGGFTLMELLVAMSLLGLVFAIVFQAFSIGIKTWEKGEATQAEYQRLRAALSLIADQISSAYPLGSKGEAGEGPQIAFEGKETSLGFVTSLPLSPKFKGGLSFTTYYLKADPTTGNKALRALEKSVLTKGFFEEKKRKDIKDDEALELLSGITEFSFEYYSTKDSDQEWKKEWEGTKEGGLPRAVRIKMKLDHDLTRFPNNSIVIPIEVNSKLPIAARGVATEEGSSVTQ
ncbi:MAG: hypothetical protein A3G93_14830 [Nitrospinae bacterium RIFCSPLOWO2_12_FULL_45_22]|nr:MAG: hypothetical protein A3G93_14830 [Nitrospinae bacterium RIFCSPLOWO2_12_FULL_45_22]